MIDKLKNLLKRPTRLPAKVEYEPAALGLYGEDMTGALNWILGYAKNDPAGAWDLYKRKLRGPGAVLDNRFGELPATRVSIQPPPVKTTRWAIIKDTVVAQIWTTHLPRSEVEKYWPGFEVVDYEHLPPTMRALLP